MEREAAQDQKPNASPRYVTDEKGERVGVILSIEEYEALLDELEEFEDIRDAEEARREIESGEDELIPLREALPRIEAERAELRRRGEL